MTICVTGGSGVVGRAVVKSAVEAGHQVRVLDPKPFPFDEVFGGRAVQSVSQFSAGVEAMGALGDALTGAEAVVHLAAALPQASLDEAGFYEANVTGTLQVARMAAEAGVRRFVFASTIEVYGAQPVPRPLAEEAPKHFTGTYSRTKYECEQRLAEHRQALGLEVVSLRMPMVMGPGFYHEQSVLRLFHALRRGWPIPIPAPDALVSFVHSEDAAAAFLLGATVPGADGLVANVAAPDTPTMLAFMRELVERTGSRSRVVVVPARLVQAGLAVAKSLGERRGGKLGGTPVELMDFVLVGGAYGIDRARAMLGYAPRSTTVEAWCTAYEWYWSTRAQRGTIPVRPNRWQR